MTQIPRKNHYVPKLLLKHFCDCKDDLHICNINWLEKKSKEIKISGSFYKRDLYNIRQFSGELDPVTENELSERENEFAPILGKLLESTRNGREQSLSVADRSTLDLFVSTQMARAPVFLDTIFEASKFRDDSEKRIEDFEALYGTADTAQKEFLRQQGTQDTILHNLRAASPTWDMYKITRALSKKKLSLLRITDEKKAFIVGCQPVLRTNPDGKTDLTAAETELLFPVSSDVAIVLAAPRFYERYFELDNHSKIRRINTEICRRSRVIGSRSKALTESLIADVGQNITP